MGQPLHLQHPPELPAAAPSPVAQVPEQGKTMMCLLAPGAESFFSSCGKGNIYSEAFLSALQASHAAAIKAARKTEDKVLKQELL